MKKITLLFILILFTYSIQSQTVAWSSDSEDYAMFTQTDLDGDGFIWGVYAGGAESFGFAPGALFFSQSWDSGPPASVLTPDNLLSTPAGVIVIPPGATNINFKLKVAALDAGFPAEKFAIYVYDEAVGSSFDNLIYETTLAIGGAGTATDIMAAIPVSFAGKTIGIIVRHYDCTDQNQLLIDDFEVSYDAALNVNDNELERISIYPNPVRDLLRIDTNLTIDSVMVSNMLGQSVLEINRSGIIDNMVDLSTLSKGLYLMTVISENKSQTIRVIKE